MTDYTKTTNFAAKDTLPSGDSGKVIRGSEVDYEFREIETAVSSKANTAGQTFTGDVTAPNVTVTSALTAGTISGALVSGFVVDGGTY